MARDMKTDDRPPVRLTAYEQAQAATGSAAQGQESLLPPSLQQPAARPAELAPADVIPLGEAEAPAGPVAIPATGRRTRRDLAKVTIYIGEDLADQYEVMILKLQARHRRKGRVEKGHVADAVLEIALANPKLVEQLVVGYLTS